VKLKIRVFVKIRMPEKRNSRNVTYYPHMHAGDRLLFFSFVCRFVRRILIDNGHLVGRWNFAGW